ncbi:3-hydroxyacyl-CoA dehydrogenase [Roseiterribacter gracilis]|uniref:3-hydroxybutyryl-CoA dehydrogenase n=1 Tax=Roseiterribacter gracilis TaxID=2812848 RepID=A0A8S8XAJ0_9PROT|nr:3-hydroxybutyryl-CoA dehydrogenase [Rhodospirillales bacterium TMPK1]
MPSSSVQIVAVVGCGTIGTSWAACFARAGLTVRLFDADPARPAFARAEAIEMLRASGDVTGGDVTALQARIQLADTLEQAVQNADYVQENAREQAGEKTALFEQLDALAPPDCILASSSSAILPSSFLAGLPGRSRCLVAHPFNPPHLIPVVELVAPAWVAPEILARTATFLESIGQLPIYVAREVDGYVGNRLQVAVVNEAMALIDRGVVSPGDLDRCVTQGLGLRWAFIGPFETMDLNAPDGFAGYVGRFGDSYQQLGRTLALDSPWSQEAIDRVAAWRRSELPLADLKQRQAWRDDLILRIRALVANADAVTSSSR